jgi:hypothetical protein
LFPDYPIIAEENSFSSANKDPNPFFQLIVPAKTGIYIRIKTKSKKDVSYNTIKIAV